MPTKSLQCVTVLYPNKPNARFDFDYYVKKHIPLWTKYLKGNRVEVRRGIATYNGVPLHYLCIVRIWMELPMDEFMTQFKLHAHHIIADIPNYTNLEPLVQFDEILHSPTEAAP